MPGTPDASAYAMPTGTSIVVSTRPATTSWRNQGHSYDLATRRPGSQRSHDESPLIPEEALMTRSRHARGREPMRTSFPSTPTNQETPSYLRSKSRVGRRRAMHADCDVCYWRAQSRDGGDADRHPQHGLTQVNTRSGHRSIVCATASRWSRACASLRLRGMPSSNW